MPQLLDRIHALRVFSSRWITSRLPFIASKPDALTGTRRFSDFQKSQCPDRAMLLPPAYDGPLPHLTKCLHPSRAGVNEMRARPAVK